MILFSIKIGLLILSILYILVFHRQLGQSFKLFSCISFCILDSFFLFFIGSKVGNNMYEKTRLSFNNTTPWYKEKKSVFVKPKIILKKKWKKNRTFFFQIYKL